MTIESCIHRKKTTQKTGIKLYYFREKNPFILMFSCPMFSSKASFDMVEGKETICKIKEEKIQNILFCKIEMLKYLIFVSCVYFSSGII